MPLRLQNIKKKNDTIAIILKKTFLKSLVINIIKKAKTAGIVSSQKTSYNLSNFHIHD